jgi:glycosyltransferase involved in cell wall biosynthesis
MAARLEKENCRAIVLRSPRPGRVSLECERVKDTPNLSFALPGEYWSLRDALVRLGIRHVHVQHALEIPGEVFDLIRELRLSYDWTIHDYFPICPRVNLTDRSGTYCGEPDELRCNVCLEKFGDFSGEPAVVRDIVRWRSEHRSLLAGARRIYVPHRDVARRLERYFPELQFTERPHFLDSVGARPVGVPYVPGEPLRVALIGLIGPAKGSKILWACAKESLKRHRPIHFYVVGSTDRDYLFRLLPNVSILGQYDEGKVFEILDKLACHCAFFASLWPETFSYTLSIALQGGLFPVAFDLGAPAARIRESGTGHLIPLTTDPAIINDELLKLRDRLMKPVFHPAPNSADYGNLLSDYYGLSWSKTKSAA